MVGIPFIYFLLLLIYVLRKKKVFDVSAYIITIYLISALFSIIIDINDLRLDYTIWYEITIVPTILYCFLLTVVIYPLIKLPPIQIANFSNVTPKFFNLIASFYVIIFFVILVFAGSTIVMVLTGDMNALRLIISQGGGDDLSIFNNVPPLIRPFVVISNVFASFSMLMLLFYFYSISFLKNTKIFNLLLFISSTSILLIAIIGVDRSKVVYWFLSYGFCILLFWKVMAKKQRKRNAKFLIVVSSIIGLYFLSLTVQRFSDSDTGTGGSVIYYAGQSFINFCYFYDVHPYNGFTLQKVFPLFYKLFVDNGIVSSSELNREMSSTTGIFHGIFNTFLGDIMMASNVYVTIGYSLFINLMMNWSLRKKTRIDFYFLILVFLFSSISLFGLFVHFYAEFTRVICFQLFFIYAFIFKK